MAGHGLYELDLFAGTGVLDNMPDVDDALVAGVGVVLTFSGWALAEKAGITVATLSRI